MEFRILGPLEAVANGQTVALGGGKQRSLLTLLLLHANETISTDRLIDDLWGERPPATAAKTVQVHISRLRKALDDSSIILTREHGYTLAIDREALDANRFERLVGEGGGELAAGHPDRAVSALTSALALWRGAPLSDLAHEPFAQSEIGRLEDLRLAALEQLIDAKLELGRHAEVVGRLEALIAEHPYRERARAQLMLALYRCDRQADALQAYQDARRTLVDELGIEPGQRLRDLERAILAQDEALMSPVPLPPEGTVRQPAALPRPLQLVADTRFALAVGDAGEWGTPVAVNELNTLSDDSPRPPGLNGTVMPLSSKDHGDNLFQIYFAKRAGVGAPWSTPNRDLLGNINVPGATSVDGFLTNDGLTLYFAFAPDDPNKADLFRARRNDPVAPFDPPEPLDGLQSADSDERDPWLTPNGQWLYYSSNRTGLHAIYRARHVQ